LLTEHFKTRTSADWLALFEEIGLPAGPVLNMLEMQADPHVIARGMIVELDHPKAGKTKALGLPVKFSETPGIVRRPAPLFGQHTREVLGEVGLSADDIERLVAEGAAIVPDGQ
jgi:crotonobetainyl-CoA:carnitine CoA-transferase CaiB-like acyl-CoA transferase